MQHQHSRATLESYLNARNIMVIELQRKLYPLDHDPLHWRARVETQGIWCFLNYIRSIVNTSHVLLLSFLASNTRYDLHKWPHESTLFCPYFCPHL